jgi:3-oxoacyl-[acyl-carrier-protein] synthase II
LSQRVYITGLGMITALGNNVSEGLLSLSQSKTGIGKINHLTTRYKDEFLAGEINLSNKDLADLVKDSNPERSRYSFGD